MGCQGDSEVGEMETQWVEDQGMLGSCCFSTGSLKGVWPWPVMDPGAMPSVLKGHIFGRNH